MPKISRPRPESPRALLRRVAGRADEISAPVPPDDREARDWADMFADSAAWLNRHLKAHPRKNTK